MALKVDYVAKETARSLVRNPVLTAATIVVVTVAVALVGASLLVRQGVSNATEKWRGDISFIIYMNPDASPEQIQAIDRALTESPQVASFDFLDQEAAYREFVELFQDDQPALLEGVTPDILPPSFKVRPSVTDLSVVTALVQQFSPQAGVKTVVAATDVIRKIHNLTNLLSATMLATAVLLTVAGMLFVGFTIQMAVFSRRREIEVMKLVGATNWFIRIPFMLEGIIQGVIGAVFGIIGTYGVASLLRMMGSDDSLAILQNFSVAGTDVFATSLVLFFGAVLITAIASAVAVSFYVRV